MIRFCSGTGLLSQLVDDKVPSSENGGRDLLQVAERMLS
jgi:hypothetical protein